jgi:hypothetical protein
LSGPEGRLAPALRYIIGSVNYFAAPQTFAGLEGRLATDLREASAN